MNETINQLQKIRDLPDKMGIWIDGPEDHKHYYIPTKEDKERAQRTIEYLQEAGG